MMSQGVFVRSPDELLKQNKTTLSSSIYIRGDAKGPIMGAFAAGPNERQGELTLFSWAQRLLRAAACKIKTFTRQTNCIYIALPSPAP